MIIPILMGGLGNQMFQYAFARALALKYQQEVHLNRSMLDNKLLSAAMGITHRSYELDIFGIPERFINSVGLAYHFGKAALPLPSRSVLLKENIAQTTKVSTIIGQNPEHILVWGYWQSPVYFEDYADVIRNDFRFVKPLSNYSRSVANQIESCTAVSVHIRRGDYVTNSKANQVHGVCDIDYYKKAVTYINERVHNPMFFIFSDDITWVEENMLHLFSNFELVKADLDKVAWEDMYLMSICQHHIIANSSFSWWGAWLNSSHIKIVTAPKNWFVDLRSINDLMPKSWIHI